MKKNRRISFLLVLGLLSVLCFAGCGDKPPAAEGNGTVETNTVVSYNKAQWIKDLGTRFGYMSVEEDVPLFTDVTSEQDYYTEVQACAEWGIITETGKFQPEEDVTWEYALNTVVRAIGIDNLCDAGYEISDGDSLSDFYLQNIASVDIDDLGEKITKDEAEQVIAYASDFEDNLEFPEIHEITYQEGVQEVTEKDILLRGDGETAYIVGDKTFEIGQVLLYMNSESNDIIAIKVSSVEDNLLTYTEAGIDDVYQSIQIQGIYNSEVDFISSIQPMEPKVISTNMALYNSSQQGRLESMVKNSHLQNNYSVLDTNIQVETKGTSFTVFDPEHNWKVDVGIENVVAKAKVDYGWFKLKEAWVSVDYDTYIHGEIKAERIAKTVPLGSAKFTIYGAVTAELNLVLNIGADGEATIDYTSHMLASTSYENGKGLRSKMENQNPSLDFHAEVTVTAEPCAKVSLKVLKEEIVNVKITTGLVAIAKVDASILDDLPTCVDLHLYVPLRWAVNEDSCLATKIFKDKVRSSGVIWDATYSAFEWNWHFEDFVQVDTCTRGQGQEVIAETTDENNVPFDEYKEFEFEPINFATIKLESSMMFLTKDETLKIGFREIPENQSQDALVYEVIDNLGVCQPNSNGTITGLAPGAANIRISTADGLYHAYITVVVQDDYTIEFNPL